MVDLLHYLSDDTILEQLKKLVPEQYHARLENWCDRLEVDDYEELVGYRNLYHDKVDHIGKLETELDEAYERIEALNTASKELEELKAKYEPS